MKKLHILLILAISTIFVNAQGFLDDKDLAAYYPFDGNTFDVSGNNHHGTGFGITYDKGKIGQCASIEQNGFIDIDNSLLLDTDYTVSFWFFASEHRFSSGFSEATKGSGFSITLPGSVYGKLNLPFASHHLNQSIYNKWTLFTLVMKNKQCIEVYIDCEKLWSWKPYDIGFTHIDGEFFKLDELYIFNRALSPDEIKELYHQTAPHVVYNDNRVAPFTYQDRKLSSNEPDYKIFEDQLITNGYKYHKESHKFYAFNGNNEIIEYDLSKASSRIITKRAIKLDFNAETSSNSIGISPNGKLLACVENGGESLRIITISSGKEIAQKKWVGSIRKSPMSFH